MRWDDIDSQPKRVSEGELALWILTVDSPKNRMNVIEYTENRNTAEPAYRL